MLDHMKYWIELDRLLIALPPVLEIIHNVFHVSQLRKYIPDPDYIISYGSLQIQKDMSCTEEPVQILDRKEKQLRSKIISFVKILWRNQHREEETWELKEEMRKNNPYLFQGTLSIEDETS